MLKKVLSLLVAACVVFTVLPGVVFADELTEIEAARNAIQKGKDTVKLYNDITSDEFLKIISTLIPDGSDVELSFDKESDFRVYNASSTKDGSVFANIKLTCGVYTRHEMYDIKMPALTGDEALANADVEKLAEDRTAVKEAFTGISLDSSATEDDVLKMAQAAVKNGSTVEIDGECTKVESTDTKKGSIKVVLKLTLNKETTTIKIYNGLKLVDAAAETKPAEDTKTDEETKPAEETKPEKKNVNFNDVKDDAYYAYAVKWAVENNITTGTSDTTFSPDDTCTRAQILTFLWRAVGSPKASIENPFTDVKTTDYYYDAAIWASEKGMVTGDMFEGNTPCTRASTVTYLWKNADAPTLSMDSIFDDVSDDAEYAPAVAWAVVSDVTSGTSDTTFSPDDICSRGQIVTFLERAIG